MLPNLGVHLCIKPKYVERNAVFAKEHVLPVSVWVNQVFLARGT